MVRKKCSNTFNRGIISGGRVANLQLGPEYFPELQFINRSQKEAKENFARSYPRGKLLDFRSGQPGACQWGIKATSYPATAYLVCPQSSLPLEGGVSFHNKIKGCCLQETSGIKQWEVNQADLDASFRGRSPERLKTLLNSFSLKSKTSVCLILVSAAHMFIKIILVNPCFITSFKSLCAWSTSLELLAVRIWYVPPHSLD